MTGTVYTTAHAWTCPAGHIGPYGEALQMIVPDGLDLTPDIDTYGSKP